MSEEKAEKKTQGGDSEAVIERGFNDDELADIMSEIEDLEKEFSEDSITQEVKKDLEKTQEKEIASADSTDSDEKKEPSKEPVAEKVELKEVKEVVEQEDLDVEVKEDREVVKEPISASKGESMDTSSSNEDLSQELNNFKVPKKEHHEKTKSKSSDVSELHHIKEEQPSFSSSHGSALGGDNRMTFSLQGQMTLNMEFICGSKVIELVVDKESFSVKLDNGMSFYLPFDELSGKKAG